MSKFTFKTEKPTGKWGFLDKPTHDVKFKKKIVGLIEEFTFDEFKIRLMVLKTDLMEDKNPKCKWKWITFKKQFKSLEEAKKFLNDNFEEITKRYELWIEV